MFCWCDAVQLCRRPESLWFRLYKFKDAAACAAQLPFATLLLSSHPLTVSHTGHVERFRCQWQGAHVSNLGS
jgi:hypothetical protein